ncbi:MAG: FAD-dependent oxidoreductase [Spirochaetes bacterium]|jgi:2,4-dienoyl-CoA reductase (NADPH2)|nr:FAD-dependent oxidoreductase [Spirochaetota bacterium]
MYNLLFSPIKINSVEIKNRVSYPALGLLYCYDGKLNDRLYNYFREKASGGAGMITVGPVGFDFTGSGPVAIQIGTDDAMPSFEKMTRVIHDEGAAAWIQIFHAGAYSYSRALGGDDPVAPSAVYSRYSKTVPRELSRDDIMSVQKEFVKAAVRAKKCGFDGVEIIGSAGYLVTQFLSPLKNLRTDEYGGSLENRTRFAREIICMMRDSLGPDYPITIRMAGNDFVPGSVTSGETPEIAKEYEKSGIDMINVTGGWHESHIPQLPMTLPRGGFAYLALNVRKAVSIPVMASNRISTPDEAERILADGMADMVNLGRVLIADPEWPKKAMEGRPEEIRPCVACNQGCTDSLFSGQPVACICNARAGHEAERIIRKAKPPKKILVAGAGPGGLEAAIRAAEAGHSVELCEKSGDIGGQLWIAAAPPHKSDLLDIIKYYRTMLAKYGVRVRLNTEVTADLVRSEKPDHVIVAEGAEALIPPIKGMDDPSVITAWKVLRDDPPLGKKIAVIGGGAVGLETAHFLAMKGTLTPEALHFLFLYEAETAERLRLYATRGTKDVTVFEMLPKPGTGIGRSTKWIIIDNLDRFGVKVISSAKVTAIKDGEVCFERNGNAESIRFDSVVNAVGSRAVKKLTESMKSAGIPFTAIGDCVKPAQIGDAVHQGFLAIMNL